MKHLIFPAALLLSCSGTGSQPVDSAPAVPQERITEIKNFIAGKNYNQQLAVFINFRIPSGKYRYFLYALKNNRILQKAVVAHGEGSAVKSSGMLRFSNTDGSHQSSLGKYEIRESYIGRFGKAYRLNGLDATNSNARKRNIVLHSYHCVPHRESEAPACQSFGCPMLSEKALKQTAYYIDRSEKPVILYTFY